MLKCFVKIYYGRYMDDVGSVWIKRIKHKITQGALTPRQGKQVTIIVKLQTSHLKRKQSTRGA